VRGTLLQVTQGNLPIATDKIYEGEVLLNLFIYGGRAIKPVVGAYVEVAELFSKELLAATAIMIDRRMRA
jgi:hypothetical protein